MAYEKTVWANGQAPALDAEHLNKIEQGIADAVSVTPQTLSAEQQAQARRNIGAGPDSAVIYTVQSLSDAQMEQARKNINAAPGGFGLGIPANLANGDVNEWHGNGFYIWGGVKPKNAPTLLRDEGTYMYMFEFGCDEGFTQIMGCYIESSPGLIYQQAFAASEGGWTFSGWKWLIR